MDPSRVAPVLPDLDTTLPPLREALGRKQFAQVLPIAETMLVGHQGNKDLLYIIAVCQRMLQRVPEALSTLASLEAYHPQYSRTYQERGHCHIFLRDAPKAIEAFEQAVRFNPALPASWQSLERLYRIAGRNSDSDNAAQHVAKLATLPVEITTARSMLADGDTLDAELLTRSYLEQHPDDGASARADAGRGCRPVSAATAGRVRPGCAPDRPRRRSRSRDAAADAAGRRA